MSTPLTRDEIVAGGNTARSLVDTAREELPSLEHWGREQLSNRELLAHDLAEMTEVLAECVDTLRDQASRPARDLSAWTPPTGPDNWVPDFSDDDDLETALVSLLELIPVSTVENLTVEGAHVVRWCMLWLQGTVDDIYPAPVLRLLEAERPNLWTNGPVAQWLVGHAAARQHAIQRRLLRKPPSIRERAASTGAVHIDSREAAIIAEGDPSRADEVIVPRPGSAPVINLDEVDPSRSDPMFKHDPPFTARERGDAGTLGFTSDYATDPHAPSHIERLRQKQRELFDGAPIEYGPLDEIGQGS